MMDTTTNDDALLQLFERRCVIRIGGHEVTAVVISEERFNDMQRALGRLKAQKPAEKLSDWIDERIQPEDDGTTIRTVMLKFDPIRIVAREMSSTEMCTMIKIPDYDNFMIDRLRRQVKRLLYNTVMQDVAEHPEDYR